MKDPLFGNKVAAAALTTLLLAVGLPIIFGTLGKVFGGHHGHHGTEENPFSLAYIPADIVIGGAEAAEVIEVSLGEMMASASVERGERAAGLCAACHTFTKGGADGIGPNLWDIVNREIGGVSGFAYSGAVAAQEGVWSYERLDPYLANSQAYIPGTIMAQMVRKDNKRADILAYLGSLSDNPAPYPEPVIAEVEEVVEDAVAEDGE